MLVKLTEFEPKSDSGAHVCFTVHQLGRLYKS